MRRAQAQAPGRRRAVTATGTAARTPERDYILELVVSTGATTERRTLEAESCEALADAVALLIAVAADPAGASVVGPTSPPTRNRHEDLNEDRLARVRPVTPAPSGPTTPADAPVPDHPTKRAVRLGALVRADVVGQFLRVLPRAAGIGFAGAAGVLLPRARVELRGRYFLTQPQQYATPPGAGGDFDLWTLGLAGCFAPERGALAFPACAGVEAGGMRGRSRGVEEQGEATSALAAITLDAAVAYAPIRWLAVRAGLQGLVVARRPRFHVRDLETLFGAGLFGLRLTAGIEVRFFGTRGGSPDR